ncbi:hypothetical protein HBI56_046950 [Parastagonospora nodorum]|nr:hypothetical protein HBH56_059860 [Parastagonospora nodorum]KAH3930883.1 hypothetical protein HBH54_103790 [Parastagonospora nodorum]KAH4140740.1 hypothetical protein HBH45_077950 [Parastagonospora nodorum]KAH4167875.1 hypothetical protein HBH44_053810 [Parastagonospora nodorum]KAH4178553.1 hypothetical protein HBH43_025630 [Parastagonospora nodorum]
MIIFPLELEKHPADIATMSDHRAGARLMIEQYTFATHLSLQNARSKYRTFSLMDQSEVDAVRRPAFAYEQLERPEDSLRLLDVLPDPEHGLVHVELREYTEKEKAQYRCLSYVWGSPTSKKHEIALNDCKFTVTRMADIYSGAIETLIWLGDKPHLNTALFLINHSHDTPAIRDILHPLVQLHSDPYWSRAWVVQEIVRSKKSIIHTMEEHAPLEHVVVAMRSRGFAEHTIHAIMPLNPVSRFDMWQD